MVKTLRDFETYVSVHQAIKNLEKKGCKIGSVVTHDTFQNDDEMESAT
jgi:hypothetical protein